MGKSASKRPRMNLFNDEEQTSLDDVLEQVSPANPAAATVECLGRTFESEAARRAFYLDLLRQKLQDPAFRQIEGFPTGPGRGYSGSLRPAPTIPPALTPLSRILFGLTVFLTPPIHESIAANPLPPT